VRNVGPIRRIAQYTSHAITGICICRQRESGGPVKSNCDLLLSPLVVAADFASVFTAV